jgi:RNA polymerase sigma-32 factor
MHRQVSFDLFRLYLGEVKLYPLLKREEEMSLAIRYREKGDIECASKLVTANLLLVVKIAMDFQRYWMQDLMDLIQEGNVGLIQAVEKFDPYRGYKFSYYASFWIKAYIMKFIMDNWKLVKIGTTQGQRKLFYNLRKEKDRLEAQGIEASPKLLSDRLNVRESEVIEMDQRLNRSEVSLDNPVNEHSEDTHQSFLTADDLPVDDQVADQEARAILHDKLMLFREQLKSSEAVIFDKRLITEDRMTLQEIGQQLGVSRERIRQVESRLKKKLKAYLEEEIEDIELHFAGTLESIGPQVRGVLASIDPNLSIIEMRSFGEQVSRRFNQERLIARLTELFGLLALLLASIGLYGVTAYNIARRTSEIGIRMALGANRADVVAMVLRGALWQIGIGLVIGIPLALVAGRAIASKLYGVGAYNPVVLAIAVCALALCAFIAGLVPARRAASIEPVEALRTE